MISRLKKTLRPYGILTELPVRTCTHTVLILYLLPMVLCSAAAHTGSAMITVALRIIMLYVCFKLPHMCRSEQAHVCEQTRLGKISLHQCLIY